MKKWSGGMLITTLVFVLIIRYCSVVRSPRKQSAYEFFNKRPATEEDTTNDNDKPVKLYNSGRKRPHFVHVEGLEELYATFGNVSKQESKSLLAWREMRLLLSRSDALPETAQGIWEAAVAWRELLMTIEKYKAAKLGNVVKESKSCPYVSVSSAVTLRNGSDLEIPCGLVEDSSITVIGIPDVQRGSFQIELIGSQLPEETKPPIVLRYNVFSAGENLTKEPVIIQNTWTNEVGLGSEERCPDHGSADTAEVDGLTKCNAKVLRSSTEEKSNASYNRNAKLTNVSDGSSSMSSSFPFVEGNSFTATLWAGMEGFHMTVNGRHETSFAYREVRARALCPSRKIRLMPTFCECILNKMVAHSMGDIYCLQRLEPWLVSGVHVDGGLDSISILANGLPVSEDLDLGVDVELLKAPEIPKKRLKMLIGVFSTGNNFERRMAIRRSWMQYEAVRSGDVAIRFFIGLNKNSQVNFELWREAQAYGDIQLMPFVDYYSLLTLKTIAICILGTKILPSKYIMKTDDDAFVRIDEVLSSLKGKAPNGLLYGLVSFESEPHRDKGDKWYVSNEEWPHSTFPPWAHGPGYIISRDIAKFIVQGHQRRDLMLFKLEDVAVGIWVNEFKKLGQEVQYVSDDRFYNAGCESNYILAHYQNPRMVLCLWEKLQKEHEANCCE